MTLLHNPRYPSNGGSAAPAVCPPEPVLATRVVRKVRGGSQAHLLAANDGKAYVTKLTNNPQQIRSVISEAFCHALLSSFGVCIPAARPILITNEFLDRHPEFGVEGPHGRRAAEPGLHFGSQYPGDTEHDAVYDYLPSSLFGHVENRGDFVAILVFDVWTMQADRRQAVFVRERMGARRRPVRKRSLRAYMVDHGMAFGGVKWDFLAGPTKQILQSPAAYETIRGPGALEPWLAAVEEFPEAAIWDAVNKIPSCWIREDLGELEVVAERLIKRRTRVSDEVLRLIQCAVEHFPGWCSIQAKTIASPRPQERATSRPGLGWPSGGYAGLPPASNGCCHRVV